MIACMRECPHCGKEAMSVLGKLFLGTARSPKCKSCGERVSVSKASALWEILVLLPPVLWAVLGGYETLPLVVAGVVAVVMSWAHYAVVPLIKR